MSAFIQYNFMNDLFTLDDENLVWMTIGALNHEINTPISSDEQHKRGLIEQINVYRGQRNVSKHKLPTERRCVIKGIPYT